MLYQDEFESFDPNNSITRLILEYCFLFCHCRVLTGLCFGNVDVFCWTLILFDLVFFYGFCPTFVAIKLIYAQKNTFKYEKQMCQFPNKEHNKFWAFTVKSRTSLTSSFMNLLVVEDQYLHTEQAKWTKIKIGQISNYTSILYHGGKSELQILNSDKFCVSLLINQKR